MTEYRVTLIQPGAGGPRTTTAVLFAIDPDHAARRAQRVLPGWTALFVIDTAAAELAAA